MQYGFLQEGKNLITYYLLHTTYYKNLFFFQLHLNHFDRAFGGADAAALAKIIIGLGFLFSVRLINHFNG